VGNVIVAGGATASARRRAWLPAVGITFLLVIIDRRQRISRGAGARRPPFSSSAIWQSPTCQRRCERGDRHVWLARPRVLVTAALILSHR